MRAHRDASGRLGFGLRLVLGGPASLDSRSGARPTPELFLGVLGFGAFGTRKPDLVQSDRLGCVSPGSDRQDKTPATGAGSTSNLHAAMAISRRRCQRLTIQQPVRSCDPSREADIDMGTDPNEACWRAALSTLSNLTRIAEARGIISLLPPGRPASCPIGE